jgi:hypothetical protein
MKAYQEGDNLSSSVRTQCFTTDMTPLKPHKRDDMLKKLHARLGLHNLYHIHIGFYYAKWSEKLTFYLSRAHAQAGSQPLIYF